MSRSADRTVKVWDALSGRELACLHGHAARVLACRFSPDGRRIIPGAEDGVVRIWDAQGEHSGTCASTDVCSHG